MSETDLIDGLRNVGNLHEFAELFGFDWEDTSEWTWHDVAVKMAEAIEALNDRAGCKNCAALNKAAWLWAKADKRARDLERTCYDYNASAREHGAYLFMWRCSNCGESYDTEMDKLNYCPNCGAKVEP